MTIQLPNNPNKFYLFIIGICILVLIILSSCDCNWHLKQAKKKCGVSLLSDTTYVHDTIYSKSVDHDTTFFYNQKDTIVIREGRLVMKYFYNDSTVYLKGECLTDTIYRDKIIITNSTELKPDLFDKWKWWIIGLFLALLLFAILRR